MMMDVSIILSFGGFCLLVGNLDWELISIDRFQGPVNHCLLARVDMECLVVEFLRNKYTYGVDANIVRENPGRSKSDD